MTNFLSGINLRRLVSFMLLFRHIIIGLVFVRVLSEYFFSEKCLVIFAQAVTVASFYSGLYSRMTSRFPWLFCERTLIVLRKVFIGHFCNI